MRPVLRLLTVLVALALLAAPLSPAHAAGPTDTDPVGVWPLRPDPSVVRRFEPPEHTYGPGHRGVDLLGSPGQPVAAALPGTVSYAGLLAGRGVVVVDHGPTRTTYEPVTATVPVGTVVAAGQQVGTLEPGHCRPRTCLHWGWREGETYLDPLRLVGAGPVRLLPWEGLAPSPGHPYAAWSPPAAAWAAAGPLRTGPVGGWLAR